MSTSDLVPPNLDLSQGSAMPDLGQPQTATPTLAPQDSGPASLPRDSQIAGPQVPDVGTLAQQNYLAQQPSGSNLKQMLQRFAYGFGQAAMKEAGLPTDYDLKNQSVELAHQQAQTQLLQQQAQQMQSTVPVTLPNGTTIMAPLALAQKLLPAQVAATSRENVQGMKGDTAETVQGMKGDAARDVANIRAKAVAAQLGMKAPNEIQLIQRALSGDQDAQKTLDILQRNRVDVRKQGYIAGAYARAATTPFSTVDENGVPTTISNLQAVRTGAVGVGKTNLTNTLGKAALIGDIRGGIQQAREYADVFDDPIARKQVAAMLAQPGVTVQTFMQSPIADTMNPRTQAATINLLNLKENAMAMRSVLGAGQGSEDLRRAIQQTIPNAATPNGSFYKQQLDTFENTLGRLEKGVPNLGKATSRALGNNGAPSNGGAPTVGQIKKFPNGNIGKWDGKGWVLQGGK